MELMCNQAHSMHSFAVMSESKRPGSAPASVGSSGSEADISDRSSVSSMLSDEYDSTTGGDAVRKSNGVCDQFLYYISL